jgi:hypothetical protein
VLTIASITRPFTASIDEQHLGIYIVSVAIRNWVRSVMIMSVYGTPREFLIVAAVVQCRRTSRSSNNRKVRLVYGAIVDS